MHIQCINAVCADVRGTRPVAQRRLLQRMAKGDTRCPDFAALHAFCMQGSLRCQVAAQRGGSRYTPCVLQVIQSVGLLHSCNAVTTNCVCALLVMVTVCDSQGKRALHICLCAFIHIFRKSSLRKHDLQAWNSHCKLSFWNGAFRVFGGKKKKLFIDLYVN